MVINFIYPKRHIEYWPTLDLYMNNIVKHIPKGTYSASSISLDKHCNIHFFLEKETLQDVGMHGINVFIPHGIADKGYRDKETVDVFDYIIISGPSWSEKYINQKLNMDKVYIGGYPKLDHLFNKLRYPQYVTWLPTHNNNIWPDDPNATVSSYPGLLFWYESYIKSTDMLKPTLKLSTHPANNADNIPTDKILLNSLCCIVDSGSTIYEALALNIPIVFPDWLIKDSILKYYKGTFEEYIFLNNIGYHANSKEELDDCIQLAIKHGNDTKTIEFIENIFPKCLRGQSGKIIASILNKLCM